MLSFSCLYFKPVLFVMLKGVLTLKKLISFCGTLTCTSAVAPEADEGSSRLKDVESPQLSGHWRSKRLKIPYI